jgi:UDP-N-acetylglucosamine diphosphorylase / glucose-1-phosphate thymidylyltransferase / UDP-N-acetylgalactosamine diphosphorylase / glucosamine-1-phosphate N-acetyltransferase / galactosamine-1-phosphate N-acetyltransferase
MSKPFHNILIYEDEIARSRSFLPLTYTRSVAELRSGLMTGIERVQIATNFVVPGIQIYLHAADHLKAVMRQRNNLPVNELPTGRTLLVNARSTFDFAGPDLVDADIVEEMPPELADCIRTGEPVSDARFTSNASISTLWNVIHRNVEAIERDITLRSKDQRLDTHTIKFAAIDNPNQLFIHPSATIGYGVVFDCSEGPIIIEENVHIMHHATIVGPAVIGKKSLVKIGAKIYGGTTIGPVSKVGGEIENSIIQGYSNKQHDGYLGHSYLGEWVNLGAGTNTSDLKNDYSPVAVTIESQTFETESLFIGLLAGDHTKSAIGTQFNTGTAVGVSSNIFSAGFPPKWIPNFSWGGAQGIAIYRVEKAIEVARAVMARRNITMNPEDEKLMRILFQKRIAVEV